MYDMSADGQRFLVIKEISAADERYRRLGSSSCKTGLKS
jgi:hypothetical protein